MVASIVGLVSFQFCEICGGTIHVGTACAGLIADSCCFEVNWEHGKDEEKGYGEADIPSGVRFPALISVFVWHVSKLSVLSFVVFEFP